MICKHGIPKSYRSRHKPFRICESPYFQINFSSTSAIGCRPSRVEHGCYNSHHGINHLVNRRSSTANIAPGTAVVPSHGYRGPCPDLICVPA